MPLIDRSGKRRGNSPRNCLLKVLGCHETGESQGMSDEDLERTPESIVEKTKTGYKVCRPTNYSTYGFARDIGTIEVVYKNRKTSENI
jgi:hypothetical protein